MIRNRNTQQNESAPEVDELVKEVDLKLAA